MSRGRIRGWSHGCLGREARSLRQLTFGMGAMRPSKGDRGRRSRAARLPGRNRGRDRLPHVRSRRAWNDARSRSRVPEILGRSRLVEGNDGEGRGRGGDGGKCPAQSLTPSTDPPCGRAGPFGSAGFLGSGPWLRALQDHIHGGEGSWHHQGCPEGSGRQRSSHPAVRASRVLPKDG